MVEGKTYIARCGRRSLRSRR